MSVCLFRFLPKFVFVECLKGFFTFSHSIFEVLFLDFGQFELPTEFCKTMGPTLSDPASWPPQAAGASSRNLGPNFLWSSLEFPIHLGSAKFHSRSLVVCCTWECCNNDARALGACPDPLA